MPEQAVNILHVEDDDMDAELMRDALCDSGNSKNFSIIHVSSLRIALDEMKKNKYDAILLDLNLSDIRGMDNVIAIKEENPDIPVIVLSGDDNDNVALEAIDNGAQEYVMKGHCNGKIIRLAIHSSIRRKQVERTLFKQANYDTITGLPNRNLFQNYLERALEKADRWKRTETVMFIDLDNFKEVNDKYGHEAGNQLLKEAAIRMSATLRSSDLIARYGGDEFTVLLDDDSRDAKSAAGQAATKLLYAFHEPFEYEGNNIDFSASIGITIYNNGGQDYITVLKSADKAMYEAKSAGGHQFRFAPFM